jgi:hypothetical protein
MTSQKDVYIPAQLVIQQHGKKAEDYALAMMQKYIKKADPQGAGVWLSIASAIDNLNQRKAQKNLH